MTDPLPSDAIRADHLHPDATAAAPDEPTPAAAAEPRPRPRFDPVPALFATGFVILAGAVVWLVRNPHTAVPTQPAAVASAPVAPEPAAEPAAPPQQPPEPVAASPEASRIEALERQVAALTAQLQQIAARPEPRPADLGPVEARLQALETRAASAQDVAHEATLTTQLGERLDQLSDRLDQTQGADAELRTLAQRAARLGQLQSAGAALAAGQPVGDLPDAPPALRRFAQAPPPTEAALRLDFPHAAAAARAASRPDLSGQGLPARMWARVKAAVTVRRGDEVIVGDPAAGALAASRQRLDAGDLAGAVASLSGLNAPAAAAMAGWRDRAEALLAARAALAALERDARG